VSPDVPPHNQRNGSRSGGSSQSW